MQVVHMAQVALHLWTMDSQTYELTDSQIAQELFVEEL